MFDIEFRIDCFKQYGGKRSIKNVSVPQSSGQPFEIPCQHGNFIYRYITGNFHNDPHNGP